MEFIATEGWLVVAYVVAVVAAGLWVVVGMLDIDLVGVPTLALVAAATYVAGSAATGGTALYAVSVLLSTAGLAFAVVVVVGSAALFAGVLANAIYESRLECRHARRRV